MSYHPPSNGLVTDSKKYRFESALEFFDSRRGGRKEKSKELDFP